jgi:hypothetical protein
MIADSLVCLALVLGVALGLARPVADRLPLSPAESLVAGVVLSLVGAWWVAWAVFTTGLQLSAYGLLPILAAAGLVAGRRGILRMWADPAARDLVVGQAIVTGWCVGWMALIRVHSGGAWLGDWFEHWERTLYFLRLWPDQAALFIDTYELSARPPLVNILTAAFLAMTRIDYAHYQIVMAALCSLAYLPVGLLTLRFGGPRSPRIAALALMLSPLFLQNATFPWTKLVAVFFILAGLYFFVEARARGPRSAQALLSAFALGGAVVAHYSAGPYVVVIAAAWLCAECGPWRGRPFLGTTAVAVLAGAAVVLPWFAWSFARFGGHSTFLSNSSVTSLDRVHGSHLLKVLLNLRDTVIPPQVRGFKGRLFAQDSPWGTLRDQFFICYQVNLPLALGSVGWAAVLREAFRAARGAPRSEVRFWGASIAGFVLLSIAVYGDREHYGIAHICLQSVVLLGLAFLAARWESLGPRWQALVALGWAVDFVLGIALQFGVESLAIDRWLGPALTPDQIALTYAPVSQANYFQKTEAHLQFVADLLPNGAPWVVALLAALFGFALLRASRGPAPAQPAG